MKTSVLVAAAAALLISTPSCKDKQDSGAEGSAASSQKSASEPQGAGKDACALLSYDEIKSVTGYDVSQAQASGKDKRSCLIHDEIGCGIILDLTSVADFSVLPTQQDRYEPVAGLGDAAFLQTQGPKRLHVKLGDGGFYLGHECNADDWRDRLVELGRLVVQRL